MVQGPGSLTIAASGNDYTGGTAIQGGSIILGVNNALPTGGLGSSRGVVTFGAAISNGTLDLAGFNQTVTGLAIASGVTTPANETITSSTGSSTLYFNGGTNPRCSPAGTIQDAAQTGGGTLGLGQCGTLDLASAATTYAGATTVQRRGAVGERPAQHQRHRGQRGRFYAPWASWAANARRSLAGGQRPPSPAETRTWRR